MPLINGIKMAWYDQSWRIQLPSVCWLDFANSGLVASLVFVVIALLNVHTQTSD